MACVLAIAADAAMKHMQFHAKDIRPSNSSPSVGPPIIGSNQRQCAFYVIAS
jgi:hypothetical protein